MHQLSTLHYPLSTLNSQLITHPKVAAALARLHGTEESLRAEIRRQYPDLKLGPAYANEEGLDRLGIVAGISIPLWNRNRKGIAEAEGKRDETRLAAIDVWRDLVCDAAAAHAHLVNLLAHPPVPPSERVQADRLADAGELTPLDYLAVREQIFDMKLDEADWKRDVALATAELTRYIR
jgi:outer membrane protein TolC